MSGGQSFPRRVAMPVVAVVILGAIAYMFYTLGDNLVHHLTPTELLARGDAAYEGSVRLAGMVSQGSVRWDPDALDLRFTIEDFENSIEVRTSAAPPMMFREGIEVIVEGRYTPEGHFEASNVLVMHSNEYRELPEGHPPPEERYRELFGDTSR